MSYTYTQEAIAPETEEAFVPSYARRSARPKKFKTWMVLAPLAGVVLIGGAATMLMNSGGGDAQPLAEPVAAPATIAPVTAAPLSSAPETAVSTPMVAATPTPAPAPVARQAEPVRSAAAPVRRAAPAPRAETARVQAPVEPTGPQSYQASSTTSATSAPRVAPAPAPVAPASVAPAPAPSISVQPLN